MKAEILLIHELQLEKVSYSTIRVDGNTLSEFEDFQTKMKEGYDIEKKELDRVIANIGNEYGAQDHFFRKERISDNLYCQHCFIDSGGVNGIGLRLYCIKLSGDIVVLLNGDKKTNEESKKCLNCLPHFEFAKQASKSIYSALERGVIEIQGKNILADENFILNFNIGV